MKERIIVRTENKDNRFSKTSLEMEKSTCKRKLNFSLVREDKMLYFFTQNYFKGIYDFFKHGRYANELKQFKNCRTNLRLDKTIGKIPLYRS